MEKPRNYGVDLLRMLSIYMVIVIHLFLHKGIYAMPFLTPTIPSFIIQWFIYLLCFCSVNCFALISGYVGIDRKSHRFTPAIMLWLQTFFYTFAITVLFSVFMPEAVTKEQWLGAVFPICTNQYWYISSYFGLLILMPILDKGINAMRIKELKTVVITLIIVFSILPNVFQKDAFVLNTGYSVIWLTVLYITGAYLKRRASAKITALKCFAGYFAMNAVSLAIKITIGFFHDRQDFNELLKSNILIDYTSPFVLGSAIFLLLAFSQLKINEKTAKIISRLSPLALGVYILHVNPLIWKYLFPQTIKLIDQSSLFSTLFGILSLSVCVYCFCTLCEFIRSVIFKLLKIKVLISNAEEKISEKIVKKER